MKTIELQANGDALRVLVLDGEARISEHIVHAVGPNGSLAYFRGGPGVADAEPTGSAESIESTRPRGSTTERRARKNEKDRERRAAKKAAINGGA